MAAPSVDAIQEFKVQKNNFSAEFGRYGGGVLKVSIKSGTNEYHRSVFEFLRNSTLDANAFFNNRSNRKLPPFRQNQFGGTFGGPVKRNKLFFFGSSQGTRVSQGDNQVSTVPAVSEKNGLFTRAIYDPATTRVNPAGSGHVRDPFPGNQIPASRFDPVGTRLRLTDPERSTLAEIGKRLGRKALKQVARVAKPDTILAWYRRLIAQKFDGSKHRSYPGRPRVGREVTELIVRIARENSGWGYERIVGALSNLGHVVSDQTVGNILRRYGIAPAPKRSQTTTWKQFLATHMAVLAGIDFFTVEVLTWRGLATYYVLFFLHLETRRVRLRGITRHPTDTWMEQVARNPIDEASGHLHHIRYVLHDRDTKFCASFRTTLTSGGVKCIVLPARSPDLNAFAER